MLLQKMYKITNNKLGERSCAWKKKRRRREKTVKRNGGRERESERETEREKRYGGSESRPIVFFGCILYY
jgi:hypothetical protein